jgi:hypothetical protein
MTLGNVNSSAKTHFVSTKLSELPSGAYSFSFPCFTDRLFLKRFTEKKPKRVLQSRVNKS